MTNKHILLRTNAIVGLIVLIGFLTSAGLGYRSNYGASAKSIEQVSLLTSEAIYYELSAIFAKPVNVSLTMANDSLLRNFVEGEGASEPDPDYIRTMQEYLGGYQEEYGYDSVFFVSAATRRYYNFSGFDRVLEPGNEEDRWYFENLESDLEYGLNVDDDQVKSANGEILVFVNCKLRRADDSVVGLVGVGLCVDDLQQLLREYEEKSGVHVALIGKDGRMELSSEHSGYEQIDFFEANNLEQARERVLGSQEREVQDFWVERQGERDDFIVARYLPELSWYLVVDRDTGFLTKRLQKQTELSMLVFAVVAGLVLLVVGYVIRGFNRSMLKLTREREEALRRAARQFYGNIYEWNITGDSAQGIASEKYLEGFGVPPGSSYTEALHAIAGQQIVEEYREGYLEMFRPEHVMKKFAEGICCLEYEFRVRDEAGKESKIKIDAHIYYCAEDDTVRMYSCRKVLQEG